MSIREGLTPEEDQAFVPSLAPGSSPALEEAVRQLCSASLGVQQIGSNLGIADFLQWGNIDGAMKDSWYRADELLQ